VPSTIHYTNLSFRLNRTDGAAVWLNGREIFRMNLPANQPLSCLDRATKLMTGDAVHTYYPTNIPVSFLPPGTNVLAVEIHKYSASILPASLSFDLELFGMGDYPPPAPPLSITVDGTDLRLSWPATNNAGFVLFSQPGLVATPSWLPLGGPYILTGGLYEYREPMLLSGPSACYQLFYLGLPSTGPRLGIRVEANAAVLSWGSGFAGFNLETTAALPGTGAWQTLSGPYTLSNGSFQARTSRTSITNEFFRLRRPAL
jgi:hypothetical protein